MSSRSYDEYKGSGVGWFDKLPEHWSMPPLYTRYEQVLGKMLDQNKMTGNHPMPYVRNVDVQWDYVNCDDLPVMDIEPSERDRFTLNKGDLLVCEGGEVGRTAIWEGENGVVAFQKAIHRLRPLDESEDVRFFYYLMRFATDMQVFLANSNPNTIPHLTGEQLRAYRLQKPPEDEQEAIASFLDVETSKIDALVSEQRRVVELLKEKRDALTRRAMQSPETQHLRLGVVADQMERQIERIDDEEYTPIGLYNRGRGIFHKEPTFGADLGDSTFFRIVEDDFVLSGQFAWEGAIALATEAENGCVASHRYPVFRGKPSVVDSAYLLAFFETPRGQLLLDLHSRGAAGRNRPLNARTLIKEKIPVPPLKVQEPIAAIVHKETPFRETAERAIALLQERRTALISAAVTGKIDVREFAYQELA